MDLKKWFEVRGWNIERLLFILQRITGWALLIYLIIHVVFVSQVTHGYEVWEAITYPERTTWGKLGFALLGAAVIFHGINGIRIILIELGVLTPRIDRVPGLADRPWLYSKRHRSYIIAMLGIETILMAYILLVILK